MLFFFCSGRPGNLAKNFSALGVLNFPGIFLISAAIALCSMSLNNFSGSTFESLGRVFNKVLGERLSRKFLILPDFAHKKTTRLSGNINFHIFLPLKIRATPAQKIAIVRHENLRAYALTAYALTASLKSSIAFDSTALS